MIVTLIEKVNAMQTTKELSWEPDNLINWPSWMKTELPEEEDILGDPDYISEEVEDNSITTSMTRTYDLRSRHRH